ncbi:MAG: hypothetical protein K9M15_01840 [Candidatus Marinimicrobia bacterium]|nr:hypothetical protein [Candidatus Neomarinimicrobiota bacterium]
MFDFLNIKTLTAVVYNPTWDIIVLFFFLATGFFYGVLAGKKKLLSVLFSLYISLLLFENLPYLEKLTRDKSALESFWIQLSAFLIVITILAILFNKTVFRGNLKSKRWWQIFILSILEVGLFVSSIFRLLPAQEMFTFSPITEMLFSSEKSFFWWIILPLITFFFILRKKDTAK